MLTVKGRCNIVLHRPTVNLENNKSIVNFFTVYHILLVFLFQIYELCVLELQPKTAVSIIECDMRVSSCS